MDTKTFIIICITNFVVGAWCNILEKKLNLPPASLLITYCLLSTGLILYFY